LRKQTRLLPKLSEHLPLLVQKNHFPYFLLPSLPLLQLPKSRPLFLADVSVRSVLSSPFSELVPMKISLSLISVGMIAAAASAGRVEAIDSGLSATYKGVITAAQLDLIKNPTNKEAAYAYMYDTNNWASPYVAGNISTTTVGAPGQGGWIQYGGATSSFKVNASSPVTATNSHTGPSMTMKGGISSSAYHDLYLYTDAAYAAQAGPGQILWLENDMYRGANSTVTTAAPGIYSVAFDTTFQCNSGFKINSYTGAVSGLGSYLNTSGVITFYAFTLSTAGVAFKAAASNWTKQASSYNVDTGETSWYLSSDNGVSYSAWTAGTTGAVAGRGALEVDFYTSNAATAVAQSTTWANSAQFTTLVPAPGAVALLGLAGIAARRRRA
jgi:hypothetical protein